MSHRRRPIPAWQAGAVLAGLAASYLVASTGTPASSAPGPDWRSCVAGPSARQAVFARAARVSGVPEAVLLGVSYMESRWDAHGGSPSTSGGFGPMHLTDVVPGRQGRPDPLGRGDARPAPRVPTLSSAPMGSAQLRTLDRAAAVTGMSPAQLRSDAVANICGGAALLARYQHDAGGARTLGDWSAAVARYSGATDRGTALHFVDQVFTTIRHGAARTTNDGQRVRLMSRPSARADVAALRALGLRTARGGVVDCPRSLACESVPAPYQQTSATGRYGNHDLANRPHDMKIDYIVIHDTEGYWDTAMQLVQDPTYNSWNYTVRSVDGHIAQHLDAKDVGYHAGNWYVNMHSIGVEHEGFAAQGASWYTEALYQDSAALVRHIAHEYGVPLDRAHILGHDQVPGINPARVASMHWDPGPFWDWEHYLTLLGHPLRADGPADSSVVTVAPGFADNPQPVTGCDSSGTCPAQGTNFGYLHTAPSADAPLVTDVGLHPDGSPSTTGVSDIGARVAAGQKLVVNQRQGDWLGVWYLGAIGWLYSPAGHPAVLPSHGSVVVPAGTTAVSVYGTAYPDQAEYPQGIPYDHPQVPLQYAIQPGQAYVLADRNLETDYYFAEAFDCVGALECTEVNGQSPYYEIWFGHRIAYVRASDVRVIGTGTPEQHRPLIR